MIKSAIAEYKKDAIKYRETDVVALSEKVAGTGFRCLRCGKCCKGEWGDNTVAVFPAEVRAIIDSTKLGWLDIVRPMESADVDDHGFYHTFEWALRKQANGDCMFLKDGACTVYERRPAICRTYPMRLESGSLELYECGGFGPRKMDGPEALRMAETLAKRQLDETTETILLLEKFRPFKPATMGNAGDRIFIVHDSEGSRKVLVRSDGECEFI